MTTDALRWMNQYTKVFLAALDRLSDADLNDPCPHLPGWSRRHVVAHVHFNAEALRRLVSWAATGIENPMYTSAEQRAVEIESGAGYSSDTLRTLVGQSAEALARDLDALDAPAWQGEVLTAQGRRIPARGIPWLRCREVAVHAIDLNAGDTFDDLDPEFTKALLIDVVARRTTLGEGAGLAAWLTGRKSAPPKLRPWL